MKKRSESQKIGTKGENAFRDFAERNGLVVTKADEDFGTDFFCVLESDPNAFGLSAITGNVIGAFVRATSGRRARVLIERSDAEHLLAARFPVSIVMVHRPRSADERIFFRFVDRVIAVRLAEFLKTKQETLTLTSSELLEEVEFRPQIGLVVVPGFVEGVTIFLASKSLQDVIPKNTIEVHRGPDGQLTIVEMDHFGEHLAISGKARQQLLHTAVFGLKERMGERFAALPINPKVETWIKQLPQPVAFVGPLTSYETTLVAEDSTGSVSCHFEGRHSRDYFGFVHNSGFAITISKAKRHGKEMVHFLKAEIDSAATDPLSKSPDLWAFLEKCTPEAHITEGKFKLEAANISWLPQCGFFARYLRIVQDLYEWPSGTWVLTDALHYETLNTLAWLCQVKEGLGWLQGWGLVLEGETGTTEEASSFEVPVCANLPRSSILTWVKANGTVFTREQRVLGFKLASILGHKLEIRPERLKKSDMPELVFHTGWPTMRIPEGALGEPAPSDWNCGVVLL